MNYILIKPLPPTAGIGCLLERNKETIDIFSSGISESQSEIAKDLIYTILVKLILIILKDKTEDGVKCISVILTPTITPHMC